VGERHAGGAGAVVAELGEDGVDIGRIPGFVVAGGELVNLCATDLAAVVHGVAEHRDERGVLEQR
jgi:hypothetical protein